jgi:TonB family protein
MGASMKAAWIALITASVVAGAASAGEDDLRWTPPPFDVQKAKWLHDAGGHLLYGRVKLDCAADADGAATDCKVVSAEPNDPARIKAAMELSRLFKRTERDVPRAVIDIDLRFDQEPALVAPPTGQQVAAVVSNDADGAGGLGFVECVVKADGTLASCQVIRASTSAPGFASTAIGIAKLFKIKPAERDGRPTESNVVIPISFFLRGPGPTGNAALPGDSSSLTPEPPP